MFVLNNLFAYEVSWGKYEQTGVRPLPVIPKGATVLIFAPHPDDETLSLGGWLTRGVADGASVHSVLLTNGDGFSLETAQTERRFKVRPRDFIDNGILRQGESMKATNVLGYKTDTFLGFPDEGTLPMWEDHWFGPPYTSPYTMVDHSPYDISFRENSPYEGRAVVDEMSEILAKYRPDIVVLPSRFETHPDHYACNLYVTMALTGMKKKPVVVEYIVHRGGYPYPYGLHPYAFLPPPEDLISLGLDWRSYELDRLAKTNKARALLQYRSQFFFAGYDIAGFYRRNEVGVLGRNTYRIIGAPAGIVRNGVIVNPDALAPGSQEPVADAPQRLLEPSGDVTMMRVVNVVNVDEPFVVATMNAAISKNTRYSIQVRSIRDAKLVSRLTFLYPSANLRIRIVGRNLEIELPKGFVRKGNAVFVEVVTGSAAGRIDRAGAFFEERR